jgi:hypothetical protein
MWLERRLDLARDELDRRLLRARTQSLEALDIGREEGAAGRLGRRVDNERRLGLPAEDRILADGSKQLDEELANQGGPRADVN